jgi:DNA-binding MarR family transcriptional regulator
MLHTAMSKSVEHHPRRTSEKAEIPPPIGFLLQRSHAILRQRLGEILAGSDIHLGHVAILGTLFDMPGLSQRDLCARTGIEKSSMVIFADALEREGLLRRDRHPADRRAHALFLTSAGVERLAEIGPQLRSTEDDYLAVLSHDERGTLAFILGKLVAARS